MDAVIQQRLASIAGNIGPFLRLPPVHKAAIDAFEKANRMQLPPAMVAWMTTHSRQVGACPDAMVGLFADSGCTVQEELDRLAVLDDPATEHVVRGVRVLATGTTTIPRGAATTPTDILTAYTQHCFQVEGWTVSLKSARASVGHVVRNLARYTAFHPPAIPHVPFPLLGPIQHVVMCAEAGGSSYVSTGVQVGVGYVYVPVSTFEDFVELLSTYPRYHFTHGGDPLHACMDTSFSTAIDVDHA